MVRILEVLGVLVKISGDRGPTMATDLLGCPCMGVSPCSIPTLSDPQPRLEHFCSFHKGGPVFQTTWAYEPLRSAIEDSTYDGEPSIQRCEFSETPPQPTWRGRFRTRTAMNLGTGSPLI